MPGFLTEQINNRVLDFLFGGVYFGPPDYLYAGLSLAPARKGGYITEPTGAGYARAAILNDRYSWTPARAGQKTNQGPIEFPFPVGDWGEVLSVFLADSPTGGHESIVAIADLPSPRRIAAGDYAPKIAAGALFFSLY